MEVIDDADDTGLAVADAVSELAVGVFIGPLATGGGLIDDDDGIGLGRVVPGDVAILVGDKGDGKVVDF